MRPGATVFMEKSFSIKSPIALSGRPDWVRRAEDGKTLVVYDFKTRAMHRTYKSDIIQLSVYAYILKQKGYAVSEQGVVRCMDGKGSFKDIQVKLMSSAQIENLYKRYFYIQSNPEEAEKNAHKALCLHCEHLNKGCSGRISS